MTPQLIDIITNDIIRLLELDEGEVFFLKAEFGQKYLSHRFQDDPEICEKLHDHPAFWLWWRELWADRDRHFMKMVKVIPPHGIWYTYPVGKPKELPNNDSYQPVNTVFIPGEDVWKFYKNFHNWKMIKFYPNYQLIHTCMERRTNKKIYVKL